MTQKSSLAYFQKTTKSGERQKVIQCPNPFCKLKQEVTNQIKQSAQPKWVTECYHFNFLKVYEYVYKYQHFYFLRG